MLKTIGIIMVTLLITVVKLPSTAFAGEEKPSVSEAEETGEETTDLQMQGQERKPWVLRALNAVKTYIDSSAVKGIDTRYLEVPEKPWAVMLKSNANDMDLRSTTYMSEDQLAAHERLSRLRSGLQLFAAALEGTQLPDWCHGCQLRF